MSVKVWVDDVRPAPEGYIAFTAVKDTIAFLDQMETMGEQIEVLDLDHDAGDFVSCGGDYIKILTWMEEQGIDDIPVRIHSMNPVGVENMKAIIQRNGWTEVR
jgi:hypothetical protein